MPGEFKECLKCKKNRPLGKNLVCKACVTLLQIELNWHERRRAAAEKRAANNKQTQEWHKREKAGTPKARRKHYLSSPLNSTLKPTFTTSP